MLRILFIHNHPAKFVVIDREILKRRYQLTELYVSKKMINILDQYRKVKESDVVLIWFASWFAFFPTLFAKLLRKKCLIFAGGYETVNMPEIHFGFQRNFLKGTIVKVILAMADQLIASSDFSKYESMKNIKMSKDKMRTIYHGLDPKGYPMDQKKEQLVITVGTVNREDLKRKGLEDFVFAAKHLPDVPFVVIGKWLDDSIDYLKTIASANVTFTGFLSDEELKNYFARAKVYVQASRHEAFGLSLAEGMLSECIPVVSKAGSLPEVVGDTGLYCNTHAPEEIAGKIKEALTMSEAAGKKARARIVSHFPLENRAEKLFAIIEENLCAV